MTLASHSHLYWALEENETCDIFSAVRTEPVKPGFVRISAEASYHHLLPTLLQLKKTAGYRGISADELPCKVQTQNMLIDLRS